MQHLLQNLQNDRMARCAHGNSARLLARARLCKGGNSAETAAEWNEDVDRWSKARMYGGEGTKNPGLHTLSHIQLHLGRTTHSFKLLCGPDTQREVAKITGCTLELRYTFFVLDESGVRESEVVYESTRWWKRTLRSSRRRWQRTPTGRGALTFNPYLMRWAVRKAAAAQKGGWGSCVDSFATQLQRRRRLLRRNDRDSLAAEHASAKTNPGVVDGV